MTINWKLRLKNPAFWLGIIPLLAVLVQVIGEPFGLDVAKVIGMQDYLMAIINAVFAVLAFLGIANDPTVKGFSDSVQAMSYKKPKEE